MLIALFGIVYKIILYINSYIIIYNSYSVILLNFTNLFIYLLVFDILFCFRLLNICLDHLIPSLCQLVHLLVTSMYIVHSYDC